jgi:hypothetical protein
MELHQQGDGSPVRQAARDAVHRAKDDEGLSGPNNEPSDWVKLGAFDTLIHT